MITGRPGVLFSGLIAIAGAAMIIALASGSADIGLRETVAALLGSAPESARSLVLDLRLPRVVVANEAHEVRSLPRRHGSLLRLEKPHSAKSGFFHPGGAWISAGGSSRET